jgi:hypothetical protein
MCFDRMFGDREVSTSPILKSLLIFVVALCLPPYIDIEGTHGREHSENWER